MDVGQKLKLTVDQSRMLLAAVKFYCFIIAEVSLAVVLIKTSCECSKYCLKKNIDIRKLESAVLSMWCLYCARFSSISQIE